MSAKRCPVGARLATVQVDADKLVQGIARRLARGASGQGLLDELADAKDSRAYVRLRVARHLAECESCNEVAS